MKKEEELCGKAKENERLKAFQQEITMELVVKRDQLKRIQECNDQLIQENERLRQAPRESLKSSRIGASDHCLRSHRAAIPYDFAEEKSLSNDQMSIYQIPPTILYNALPTPRGNLSYRHEIEAINARARSLSARNCHPTS